MINGTNKQGVPLIFEDVLSQIFLITFNQKNYGTCFTFSAGGVLYFITTADWIEENPKRGKITFYIIEDQGFRKIENARCFLQTDLNVAVIKTNILSKSRSKNLRLSSRNLILGQDLYILGFPQFSDNNLDSKVFPMPIVKKVTLSGIHAHQLLIDGRYEPGFLGSPVIFWDYVREAPAIAGVLVSFLSKKTQALEIESGSDMADIMIACDAASVKKKMVHPILKGLHFLVEQGFTWWKKEIKSPQTK